MVTRSIVIVTKRQDKPMPRYPGSIESRGRTWENTQAGIQPQPDRGAAVLGLAR